MEAQDLNRLKHFASTTRSAMAFGGSTFIKWDYKNGKYLVGKNNTDVTGRELVADLPDTMGGYQRLEAKKKPEYAVVKILGDVEPIERDELGETDKSAWLNDKDPWTPVTVLPLFDLETRQVFIFCATYGGRDAASNLLEAFADNATAHPEAADQLPLVQLSVRTFTKNDGNPGYAVALDINGWTDRPPTVPHVQQPPLNISAAPGIPKTNGKSKAAEGKDTPVKPKRKIAVPGGTPDWDDEVSF